jgi:excisionase family DNA binding protein
MEMRGHGGAHRVEKLERLLLRPVEVAELIGVSKSRVYEMIARGEVPSIEIGNSRTKRVPMTALKRWISEKLAGSRTAAEQTAAAERATQ